MVSGEEKRWLESDDLFSDDGGTEGLEEDGKLTGEEGRKEQDEPTMVGTSGRIGYENIGESNGFSPSKTERLKSKRGFGEPEKLVRGKMLKKLLKYDYRALFKFLLPMYIAILAVAAVLGICFSVQGDGNGMVRDKLLASLAILYVMGIMISAMISIVNIVTRYQKNLFSGEGYLTLTIPATAEEHIFSKLISGLSTIALTVVVAILSVFVVTAASGIDLGFSELIGDLFDRLSGVEKAHAVFFILEGILLLISSSVLQLGIVYSCICIGQLFVNKNRKTAGGAAFIIYLVVMQVGSIFSSPILSIFVNADSLAAWHLILWGGILISAAGVVLTFFLQRYIIKNKVNLA